MSVKSRVPLWVTAVIIVAMLPAAAFPLMMSAAVAPNDSVRIFLWLYPFYVLASGALAWYCYDRRPAVTWVLVVLMLLTHGAMWLLVDPLPADLL